MMAELTPRERRLLALALLLLAVTLLIAGIIRPIVSGFSQRSAERASLDQLVAKNHRSIASTAAWRQQIERFRGDSQVYGLAVSSRSEGIDQFRNAVAKALQTANVTVSGLQEIPGDDSWLRLRLDAELSLTQLINCLSAIKGAKQLIVVEAVTINADRAFSTGRLSLLDVRLEISIPYSLSAPR